MNLPPVFHLPGVPSEVLGSGVWRGLADTPLRVPVLGAADIGRVWQALDQAAATWREHPLGRRVERIHEVMAVLRERAPVPWHEVLARSVGLSHAGMQAAWEATFAPHDAELLHEALQLEALDQPRLERLAVAGRLPRRILHVLSGNVLPPTLGMLLRGWLLGAAQWLRPAGREPLFAACLLAEVGALVPELAACTAVCWWPHDDTAMQPAVLAAAQVVTVQGSDGAVAAIRERLRPVNPAARLVGYGSRWSGALVSSAAQTRATASDLALDIALFDQQGCLSPSLVFAERSPGLREWCAQLAAALAERESSLPRGPLGPEAVAALRHWHETARLAVALGDVEGLWEPADSTAWGVVLLAACADHDSPLDRHVVVVPFESIDEIVAALGERQRKLQGLAVALEGWPDSARDQALRQLEPTRIARAGTLQQAPLSWKQDHLAPFGSLLLPAGSPQA